MTARRPLAQVLASVALTAAVAGCASRPAEHFYTVSGEDGAPDPAPGAQRIVVTPIAIPALIDRPQLVVRTGAHEIAVLENHRWAVNLPADLTRALANDLRRVRPELDIEPGNAPQAPDSARILDVTIAELATGPGPGTSVQASWDLRDPAGSCVNQGTFEAAIPTRAGHDAIPAAYAEAMARLADAIGRTIPDCTKKTFP